MRSRLLQLALTSMIVVAGVFAFVAPSSAQEDGTTTTTQLDIGGDADATTTTQLEVGTETPPNRVDAGGGGTAADRSAAPFALIAFAGGLIVVTTAAARRMRAGQR